MSIRGTSAVYIVSTDNTLKFDENRLQHWTVFVLNIVRTAEIALLRRQTPLG